MTNMTEQEIIAEMSKKNYELSFAVEGKWTNMRVFGGSNDNNIYMRLDCFQQYSVPLSPDGYRYLEKKNEFILELSSFGFPAPLENKERIVKILSTMKPRKCRDW